MAFDPITEGIQFARDIVNKIFPDAENKEQRVMELAALLGQRDQQQIELNKVEAQSPNLFVSGWRPAMGWVCVGSLTYVWIIRDIIAWGFGIGMPTIELGLIMEILFGLLGLSGMRSWEKWKGVSK